MPSAVTRPISMASSPHLRKTARTSCFAAALGDEQHALLRFAEHHFVGRHAGFALRDAVEIDFDAHAAARSHFAGGAGEPGGAHILNGDDGAGGHGFEAGFEQKFFEKGIADLHVGALLLRFLGEFGGGQQRGAVNAVAAGLGADVDDRIAFAAGAGEEDVFLRAMPRASTLTSGLPE